MWFNVAEDWIKILLCLGDRSQAKCVRCSLAWNFPRSALSCIQVVVNCCNVIVHRQVYRVHVMYGITVPVCQWVKPHAADFLACCASNVAAVTSCGLWFSCWRSWYLLSHCLVKGQIVFPQSAWIGATQEFPFSFICFCLVFTVSLFHKNRTWWKPEKYASSN